MKISELVRLLKKHMDKHGDQKVMLYDGYEGVYKTINQRHISRTLDRLVIECPCSREE